MPTLMKKAFLSFFLLILVYSAKSQAGIIDSSFGENGKVITGFDNDVAICYASTHQKDGKILTVGSGSMNNNGLIISGFLVVRYTADGQPDETFGNAGRIVINFENGAGEAHDVVVQDDGKIIVVGHGGTSLTKPSDILMTRLNANGSLDSSFGLNGKVITDFENDESARAIALQNDGKIVVAGNYNQQSFLTVRYLQDGTMDNSFGDKGKVIALWGGLAFANDVLVQQDGKIVAIGSSGGFAAMARYLPDGNTDLAFGNNGVVMNSFGFASTSFKSAAINKSGNITCVGSSGDGFTGNMLVAKYSQTGKPDSAFGTNGHVSIIISEGASQAVSLGLPSDEKIVVMGYVFNSFNGKKNMFAVSRLLSTGQVDESFGTQGKTTTDFGIDYWEFATGGFINDDDEIIVTGTSGNYDPPAGYAILMSRYNYEKPSKEKYIRIKKWLHHHGITWEDKPDNNISYYAIERSNGNNSFTEIAKFKRGNQQFYNFEDATALSGNNYYRVMTLSLDGTINYSNTIAIQGAETSIKVYPNPAKDYVIVKAIGSVNKNNCFIRDVSGRKIAVVFTSDNTIDVSKLSAGIYFLHVMEGTKSTSIRFVKL